MAFRCVNCNGSMVFDIPSQQMKCQHCGSMLPPEAFQVRDESAQSTWAELTRYECQNCGAALESTEDSMIGVCPYCGGQSMLSTGAGGPTVERLIPFQIAREQCAEGYRSFAKKVPYLPGELKNPEFLQNFTGIYMPYYTYDVALGKSNIKGSKTVERHSNYEVVNTYQIDANVDGEYCGIPFDASRYLDDEISARALPFQARLERPFHPSYLSGFYADSATVDPGVYYQDAAEQASQDVVDTVADMVYQQDQIKVEKKESSVEAEVRSHHSVLFPLWFLTWRKGERVAYAVVNGESGKVVSDLPVDMRAFAAGCGVISLVLFLILELLFQPTPLVTSMISLVASILMAVGLRSSTKQVYEKQVHANDKGWGTAGTGEDAGKKKKTRMPTMLLTLVVIFGISAVYGTRSLQLASLIVAGVAVLAAILVCRNVLTWQRYIQRQDPAAAAVVLVAAVILNALIVVISPVNDAWYYLGDAVCILGLVFSSICMIRVYNEGTTRPLPKLFDRNEVV